MTEQRPVTPRDYLPVARDLLEHREEMRDAIEADRDQDVAGRDQADAAARDARGHMRRTVDDLRRAGIQPTLGDSRLDAKTLAWDLALGGAITRRIPADRKCEHATPAAQRPLVASLTQRWMLCRECAPRLAPRLGVSAVTAPADDDGRCDVCDRDAIRFSEFQTTIGPLQVTGDICSMCRYWREGTER